MTAIPHQMMDVQTVLLMPIGFALELQVYVTIVEMELLKMENNVMMATFFQVMDVQVIVQLKLVGKLLF
jgi:hypothetical protein